MTPSYVCVHGHFYQPPRENPWLDAIEPQPSAHPYHDWNERILEECYRPNSASRILDGTGRISRIVNNYASMSFDVGPTLMAWLEQAAPDVYGAILDADRISRERLGRGSALAQAYNHMIMPLANERDRRTQTAWGIRDFRYRFGREPDGMWLPETAVDTPTLEALADHGIQFTILAPHQAHRVRRLGRGSWYEGEVDSGRAYRVELPSGRSLDVFFYDGEVSSAVAFKNLLSDGSQLADRLLGLGPGLAHIATDGESYGHHHRHGDMALAYAVDAVERGGSARIINYAAFRDLHPAEFEVQIAENTAWSCAHGVDRWRDDCGCNTGKHPPWRQLWRRPLRDALDWLRDGLADAYEQTAGELLRDPWAARDDYIEVVLDRGADRVERFFRDHGAQGLTGDDMRRGLALLEMQRHAMLMYTSCGWFFDDVSGTEASQVLVYAARAAELARTAAGVDLEPGLLSRLAAARSNVPHESDARRVYETRAAAARVDLRRVIEHYAVDMAVTGDGDGFRVYSYRVEPHGVDRRRSGRATLVTGRGRVISNATLTAQTYSFAALHLGEHHFAGGVRCDPGDLEHARMAGDITARFDRGDFVGAQRQLDRHFLDQGFSLRSLFPEHRARILEQILHDPLSEAEAVLDRLYDHHAPLLRYLTELGLPAPEVLRHAAGVVAELRLRRALARAEVNTDELRYALEEANRAGAVLDQDRLALAWQRAIERAADRLSVRPDAPGALDRVATMIELAEAMPIEVNLWHVQNVAHDLSVALLPARRDAEAPGVEHWRVRFVELCEQLGLRTDARVS